MDVGSTLRELLSLVFTAAMIVSMGAVASSTADPPTVESTTVLAACVPSTQIEHDGVKRKARLYSGLALVGTTDAYSVKADLTDSEWATFSHISGFNTSAAEMQDYTVRIKGSAEPYPLGHANGLAYYRTPDADPLKVGSFYIPMIKAAGDHQIAQVNDRGEITKLFKARQGKSDKRIASLTHLGKGRWIVATAGEASPDPDDPNLLHRVFYTATVEGNYFELDRKFFVPTTRSFDTAQDIAYNPAADELLVPVWDGRNKVGSATRLRNRIIVVRLGTITENQVYRPVRWIDYAASAAEASLFEVEGIDVDSEGNLFVGTKAARPKGSSCSDDSIDQIVKY